MIDVPTIQYVYWQILAPAVGGTILFLGLMWLMWHVVTWFVGGLLYLALGCLRLWRVICLIARSCKNHLRGFARFLLIRLYFLLGGELDDPSLFGLRNPAVQPPGSPTKTLDNL